MRVIAITGPIASGKSTVMDMIQDKGHKVILADKVTNYIYQSGNEGFKALKLHFPTFIRGSKVDRKALGELIRNDAEAKKFLDEITHPIIIKDIQRRLLAWKEKGEDTAYVEVPLLFQAHWANLFSITAAVDADESKIVKRLMKRNNITKEEAMEWISIQLPVATQSKKADFVINNNTKADLKKSVAELLKL